MLFIPPLGSSRASGMVPGLGIPPQGLAVASEPFCPPRITAQDGALHPHGCCSRDVRPRQGRGWKEDSLGAGGSSCPQKQSHRSPSLRRASANTSWVGFLQAELSGAAQFPSLSPKIQQSCRSGSTPVSGAFLAASSSSSILRDSSASPRGAAAPCLGPAGKVAGRTFSLHPAG